MDRIELLRVFTRVVDCQSFTKAAETMALPRSTVSMAVKALEEAVGSRLLSRTTRVVATTSDGAVFYERALRLLADYDEVESLFRQTTASLRGKIKVNVPARIGRLIIAPALPQFLAAYPDIEIMIGITDQMVDLHQEGVDCVIRIGELSDSSLIAKRVGMIEFINCASPAYLKSHGNPGHPDELGKHRSIAYASTTTGKTEAWEIAMGSDIVHHVVPAAVTVDSSEMLIGCCVAGLGIAQAPEFDVRKYVERGELVEIMPDHRPAPEPIHILYPHRRHYSNRTRVFVDWVTELLHSNVASRARERGLRKSR